MLSAVLMEIAGILMLYFSILFKGPYSLPASAVALVLIIYGLFMPYAGGRKGVSLALVDGGTANPFENSESLQKRRMIQLRRSDLENQRSQLNSRILKLRRSLKEQDEILHEPYLL